ncbi:ATP-binding cassette domain-containing protein [Allorhizobium sp. BGMRC 0089]|uniref:thiamine ABC transporter ATP-binding protein n=1 Tax=Allorhizobium sonneratiae TaxID=2934936 RepID=UPI002033DC16|nr:ATP-binding cassette domain-containing protein [Allorhizobium sonneratiae]MCM2293328.1 ATP-binding cassette domain-containing protein [Allorhizobium sonneratiae]
MREGTGDGASITLDHVGLRRGETDFAFDGDMAAGRITAITGASGAGKSTLLNLIAGFVQPSHGHVRIGGEDMTRLLPGKRPISLIFQEHNLFAHLDLMTNIGLGIDPSLKLTGEERKSVSQALERVGLAGFEKRKPGSLSGGEKQRAAFARSLVRRRPVLLLDEPFAALDPALRADMADLLIDLHRETGNTVVLVTHDHREVERLADDLWRIDGGCVVERQSLRA